VNKAKAVLWLATRFPTSMLALSVCVLWSADVGAASMPSELIGEWTNASNYCNLEISRFRFTGTSDGEGYGCDLKSIRQPDPSFKTWTIESSCSGENPKKMTVRSTFSLQEFEGGDLLVRIELVNNRTEVALYRRCKQ
jgi:hypothetical protein